MDSPSHLSQKSRRDFLEALANFEGEIIRILRAISLKNQKFLNINLLDLLP